jgi:hypothetical protein
LELYLIAKSKNELETRKCGTKSQTAGGRRTEEPTAIAIIIIIIINLCVVVQRKNSPLEE